MNNKFDELTKQMAQSVTRRQALKKFGVGLAATAFACFGLASKADAKGCGKFGEPCNHYLKGCCRGLVCLPSFAEGLVCQ